VRYKDASTVEWGPFSSGRNSDTQVRRLLNGEEGTNNNYEMAMFQVGNVENEFPRHRHNFAQLRYGLVGEMPLSRDGKLSVKTGQFVYQPDGVSYGPYTFTSRYEGASLQFGGASGNGYLSYKALAEGAEKIKAIGRSEGGVFKPNDPNAKKKDGYEAAWEAFQGRPVEYPVPRYSTPLEINPAAYRWLDVGEGVETKLLSIFDERRTTLSMYRLSPGASFRLPAGHQIQVAFITRGALHLGQDLLLGIHSGFEVSPKEELHLTNPANEEAEFFIVALPSFELSVD
jgi:hypothetical protein